MELCIHIQIGTILLLIFIAKFSPLPGFEPGTSLVPSQYGTNWAILASVKNRFHIIFMLKRGKNIEKIIFDKQLWFAAPVCWSKHTTSLLYGLIWKKIVKPRWLGVFICQLLTNKFGWLRDRDPPPTILLSSERPWRAKQKWTKWKRKQQNKHSREWTTRDAWTGALKKQTWS